MKFYLLLFDVSGFIPRWSCGHWTEPLAWLHIISDLVIFMAYTAIPIILAYFVLKRRDTPFSRLFWLFSTFIFACGSSHLIDALIFWIPYYRFSALVKCVTAVISWITFITFYRSFPDILAFPGATNLNSQLNRALLNLNRVNQGLQDFVSIASYHLKQPLARIKTLGEELIESYREKLPAEELEKMERIIRQTHRMNDLIYTLEHYTRFGLDSLPKESVDLNSLLHEVIDSLNATLEQSQVQLIIEPHLPKVVANPVSLREVFYNLITNALKYNDKSIPSIHIGAKGNGAHPVFYVKDNGIGIAEKHFQSVFRIFKRLQNDDRYGSGHGAGLTIVKKIIECHGGTIWLKSEIGKGTTFYFTLNGAKESQKPKLKEQLKETQRETQKL